jgi:predicted O-methyltransferase YrrM
VPARSELRQWLVDARFAAGAALLPPQVAWFQVRARRLARQTGDVFSLTSVTRPRDLRTLLAVARGRRRVVELGTATGWTAISLALADARRTVLTCDIAEREEPQRYLGLVDGDVRARIELAVRSGAEGPADDAPVDLLYIDSSHERAETIAEVLAWRPALRAGAVIVFDDYTHPDFPGVREAVAELGLSGGRRGTLFVHHVTDRA